MGDDNFRQKSESDSSQRAATKADDKFQSPKDNIIMAHLVSSPALARQNPVALKVEYQLQSVISIDSSESDEDGAVVAQNPNADSLHLDTQPAKTNKIIPPDDSSSETSEIQKWRGVLMMILKVAALLCYLVYLGLALTWNFHKAIPLVVITALLCLVYLPRFGLILYRRLDLPGIKSRVGQIKGAWRAGLATISNALDKRWVKVCCYTLVVVVMVTYVISQNLDDLHRLRPMAGLLVIVVLCWLVSYNRREIRWRPVIWGLGLQMTFGVVVLRTSVGESAFRFLGLQVERYLNYVVAGIEFVFGENYADFYFIFRLMPAVIFISVTVSVAYHVGLMKLIVNSIAWAMSLTMGTTAAESTSCAACIFLGQPEASLTIRPFLRLMTRSELFAILTAGFSSVTADVFSVFVHYGMSSSDIIIAMLMSAPAAMAISKIICPETEVSLTKTRKQISQTYDENPKADNVVDAVADGARVAVTIIAAIIACLIAFLSIVAFLDAVVTYLGELVNVEGLTLGVLIAYPLMPLVYLMGVPWEDCRLIGEVIGLKTFINELVAFQRLDEMVSAGLVESNRSVVITMYALCGYSNPTSMGVALGGLSALVPEKRQVMARLIMMTWLSGSLACFMTAAWAGRVSNPFSHFSS